MALLQTGCSSLFTSGRSTVKSPWNNFAEAKAAFDKIEPGKTKKLELQEIGFDPYTNPNVRILTYLDIMNRFLPNNSMRLEDLPPAVRDCLKAQERSQAYELDINVTRSQRYGNLFLDMFAFNRKTRETGWNFKALVLFNDGMVVYKLWSGQPNLERYEQKKKPLGPLQELDGSVGIGMIR
ncbi:MAG: hypothetical protein AB1705_22420 [Verrucomicrobiota bacterium]